MLRSALNASITCFLGVSTSPHAKSAHPCVYKHRKLASFGLQPRYPLETGRMADVLDIVGPLDIIFPPSAAHFYAGLLRRCIKSGNTMVGGMVHAHLMKSGLGAEPLVSNVLLNVYAKMGHLDGCTKMFGEMPHRDVVSWCTLISGYVSHGFDLEAFGLLKRIYGSGLKPNHFIISAVLKGCSNAENLELGVQVHTAIVKSGLMSDSFVEVGLISMYAKFGAVLNALKLFYEIPVKCLGSWNAMISGYVQNSLFVEAINLSQEMCRMGFIMDLVTLRIVATAGSALMMLVFFRNLHAYSIKLGLDGDNYVVAEYVKLLSKLGKVDDIGKLFRRVRKPDTSLFSLIISGYYANHHRFEAVKHAEQLFRSDLNLNQGTAVSVINLCLFKEEGRQLHAHFLKGGYDAYLSVSNALISMYINCGLIKAAKITFAEMRVHDIVSWTAIMSGHGHNGQFGEVFKVFQSCLKAGVLLDQYTIATVINACTGLQALDQGKQVHALVLKIGIEFTDFLAASLLHMYAKCGDINSTTRLFSDVPSPHGLVLVNVMLAGYCWNSLPEKALQLFHTEHLAGFAPDEFSFSTALGACADLRLVEIGQQLHSHVIKSGFELTDVVVGNAIINLYVKSGNIENACRSFYGMTQWDSNSYTMLISGYVRNKCSKLAVELFCQMHQNGLRANPVAFSSILRGCTHIVALEFGKQVHASVLKMGFDSNSYIVSSIVGMYSKFRDMDGAVKGLNEILIRDGIQWNSVITGDRKKENEGEVYKMFELMNVETLQKGYISHMELWKTGRRPCAIMQGMSTSSYEVQKGCISGNSLFIIYSRIVFLKQPQNAFRKMITVGIDTYTYTESGFVNKLAKLLKMKNTEKDKMFHALLCSAHSHYDFVKGRLFCANNLEKGQQNLTIEGDYYTMVKNIRQAIDLDENQESMSPMHSKFNTLVQKNFRAVRRSHINVDSQGKTAETSATYPFTIDLIHNVMEELLFSLLENEDRVLVILVGCPINVMALHTLIMDQKPPSLFTCHPWECG